jgi:hypothetical protein
MQLNHLPPAMLLQVQRDYNELPAEAVSALRDSLFALLLRYAKDSPAVRTQLCLALAALAAHAPAALWGGQGVLGWLMNAFSSQPREVALSGMLELMTVLPQVGAGLLRCLAGAGAAVFAAAAGIMAFPQCSTAYCGPPRLLPKHSGVSCRRWTAAALPAARSGVPTSRASSRRLRLLPWTCSPGERVVCPKGRGRMAEGGEQQQHQQLGTLVQPCLMHISNTLYPHMHAESACMAAATLRVVGLNLHLPCVPPFLPRPPGVPPSCLSVEGERLRRQVLEAWGCWLRLTPVGGGISAAGPALASHPLVAAALEGLSREATFDAAVDAVRRWGGRAGLLLVKVLAPVL